MQESYLYEYAVIRIVPRVEREEFINAGVILYARQAKFLGSVFTINEKRLQALSLLVDIAEVEQHLRAIEQICTGSREGGPIGRLDVASRFRWLTATRSTVVQTSKVHPGFCADAATALQKLYSQLVL